MLQSSWCPGRQKHVDDKRLILGAVPGGARCAAILLLGMLAAGCAGSPEMSADFDRHRYSRLVRPVEAPDRIWFDVMFPAAYPEGDAAADAVRQDWLEAWLAQRRLCPAGHEVVKRRPFEYLEDNPGGYRQRWEIRCTAPATPPPA